jgi:hypothetical protein
LWNNLFIYARKKVIFIELLATETIGGKDTSGGSTVIDLWKMSKVEDKK